MISDDAWAKLTLLPHMDDDDTRRIALEWHGCVAARMEIPNDEAIAGHPLYRSGLREVLWAGEVLDSALIADLESRNSVHVRHDPAVFSNLRHWILRLKGHVVEVVARSIEVERIAN
jgi:hypothetical protein